MGATVVISSASHHRIARGRAWLERAPAEEVLILGTTPDAANGLARIVVQTKGAAFGYHRMTLARLKA
jgi:ATP-dependent helicase/nuclease subunit B